MIASLTGTHAGWVLGVARIVLGIVFFAHGAQKLLGWYGGPGLASGMRTFTEHLHLPPSLAFLVIAVELFSGVGLIVGLFTRIAARIIALALVIVAEGAGKVSLDPLLHGHISGLELWQEATQKY